MRRLFGKFILAFWLAFAAISLTLAGTAWLIRHQHSQWLASMHPPPLPPFDPIATLLQAGKIDSVRILLAMPAPRPGPRLRVLDPQGQLLAGPGGQQTPDGERQIRDAQGKIYRLQWLTPLENGGHRPQGPMGPMGPPGPPPLIIIAVALLASLGFSAGLAWYIVGPVRRLRQALHAIANGQFDTRIGELMGRRRDELADLATDFDAMAQQLEQQRSAQQRLLHDVSHELRSPLARLQAASGLLRRDPGRLNETLERIEREVQRLDNLVDEVLTLARLENRVAQPQTTVDLIELLQEIAEDARFEAQASGGTLRIDAPGSFVLPCQAALLYRSFENVIRNAVKFSPPGEEILIRARVEADGLKVVVRDHGPGVDPGSLQAIFQPFHREGEAEGYGLGLAIARRAIESHRGRITASLPADGGLAIDIFLPGPP